MTADTTTQKTLLNLMEYSPVESTQKKLLKLMAYSPGMKTNAAPHGQEGGIPLPLNVPVAVVKK